MKTLILAGLFLAAAPIKCKEDDSEEYRDIDEVGYVAEDIFVRKTVEDWEKFLRQADSTIMAAEKDISVANDRLYDLKSGRSRLKGSIVKAETRLETLCERLQRISAYNYTRIQPDEEMIQKMEDFKDGFYKDREKLNEALKELKE